MSRRKLQQNGESKHRLKKSNSFPLASYDHGYSYFQNLQNAARLGGRAPIQEQRPNNADDNTVLLEIGDGHIGKLVVTTMNYPVREDMYEDNNIAIQQENEPFSACPIEESTDINLISSVLVIGSR